MSGTAIPSFLPTMRPASRMPASHCSEGRNRRGASPVRHATWYRAATPGMRWQTPSRSCLRPNDDVAAEFPDSRRAQQRRIQTGQRTGEREEPLEPAQEQKIARMRSLETATDDIDLRAVQRPLARGSVSADGKGHAQGPQQARRERFGYDQSPTGVEPVADLPEYEREIRDYMVQKGINPDQIERLLRIPCLERAADGRDPIGEAAQLGAPGKHLKRAGRNVQSRDLSAESGEHQRVFAESGADIQHRIAAKIARHPKAEIDVPGTGRMRIALHDPRIVRRYLLFGGFAVEELRFGLPLRAVVIG